MGWIFLPTKGDTYKSPSSDQPLYRAVKTNNGPYFNISVTLDEMSMRIVNRWPRGTKSEQIRLAIKNYANGNNPGTHEYIMELQKNIAGMQRLLASKSGQIEMLESQLFTSTPGVRRTNLVKRFVRSAWGLIRHPIATLREMRRGSD
jgi:hypothetical protein